PCLSIHAELCLLCCVLISHVCLSYPTRRSCDLERRLAASRHSGHAHARRPAGMRCEPCQQFASRRAMIAAARFDERDRARYGGPDRKSTRLNSSHVSISYAVCCLKNKKHEV